MSGNNRVVVTVQNAVGHVRLVRGAKMNALDGKMMQALIEAGEQLAEVDGLRVVVLSAEGKAFCAGLDQSNFAALASGGGLDTGTADEEGASATDPSGDGASGRYRLTPRTHGIANLPQQLVWVWRQLPVPVIAAIEGVAYGGGLQLSLGADIRYAGPLARFSVMEIRWGLVPDMGGVQLLRHLVGDDVARELTYTGRILSAQEALEAGLVTAVYEDPLAAAEQTAQLIAGQSPDAVQAAKRLFNEVPDLDVAASLLRESEEQDVILGSKNQLEAVMAQLEKRPAEFDDSAREPMRKGAS